MWIPIAHGGSLTWDEMILVVAAYGLLFAVVASGRNRRVERAGETVRAHRSLAKLSGSLHGDAISILDVSHRYGRKWVVSRFSLTIVPGQFVSVLGANGAGKTTLLNILSTLEVPTVGDVVVGTSAMRTDPGAVRSKVGVVAHQPLLYPRLSVIENLRFFARLFEVTDPAVIESTLRRVSMWDHRHQQAGRLSRGQKQRVAFARALLHTPTVLLLDEPYAGLDLIAAERLDGLLDELHRAGLTIVMTSHDLPRSYERADRLVIMGGGRVAYDRPKDELSLDQVEGLYRKALAASQDDGAVTVAGEDAA